MRGATGVEQDWPGVTSADCLVESSADGRWKWNEDRLAAFAQDAQNPVAMFFAEVGDVEPGGFEDAQAPQSEQADQGEVVLVLRVPGGGQ